MKTKLAFKPATSIAGVIAALGSACVILVSLCSCHKSDPQLAVAAQVFVEKARLVVTNDLYQETIEAAKAMQTMQEQNQLPGILKSEHGRITSDKYMLMVSNNLIEVVYPLSQTFRVVKAGETSTNIYVFERLSKDTLWQLARAWQTDSNGHVITNWTLK